MVCERQQPENGALHILLLILRIHNFQIANSFGQQTKKKSSGGLATKKYESGIRTGAAMRPPFWGPLLNLNTRGARKMAPILVRAGGERLNSEPCFGYQRAARVLRQIRPEDDGAHKVRPGLGAPSRRFGNPCLIKKNEHFPEGGGNMCQMDKYHTLAI